MANDNTQRDRQSLFNAINEAGFDIGKYDDFNSRMDNADDRRKFYDAVSDAGYDIGGFDEFERRMVGSGENKPSNATPTDVITSSPSSKLRQALRGNFDEGLRQGMANKPKPILNPNVPTLDAPQFGKGSFNPYNKGIGGVRNPIMTNPMDSYKQKTEPQVGNTWNKEIKAGVDENGRFTGYELQEKPIEDTGVISGVDENGEYVSKIVGQEGSLYRKQQEYKQATERPKTDEDIMSYADKIDKQFAEAYKRDRENNASRFYGTAGYYEQGSRLLTPETNNLAAAKAQMDEARNIIEAARRAKGDRNALLGFLEDANISFWKNLTDFDTWDFGLKSLEEAQRVRAMLDKFDKGEKLSPSEEALLNAVAMNTAAKMYYGSEQGMGETVGATTAQMIPFMIQMAVSPSTGWGKAASSTVLKKLAKYAGKKFLTRAAVRGAQGATRILTDIGAGYVMAGTVGAGRTLADMERRMTGSVDVDPITFKYAGREKGDDAVTASAKALTSQAIEFQSEMVGEYFKPLLGMVGKSVTRGVMNGGSQTLKNYLNAGLKAYERMGRTKMAGFFRDLNSLTRYDGAIGEYLEEVVGNIENATSVGDLDFSTDENGVFNLKNNVETFLSVAVPGVAQAAMTRSVDWGVGKYKEKKDKACSKVFGEEVWNQFKPEIDALQLEDSTPEELANAFTQIAKNINPQNREELEALRGYFNAVVVDQAIGMGQQMKEANTQQDVQDVVEGGIEEGREMSTPEDVHENALSVEDATQQLMEFPDGEQLINTVNNLIENGASDVEVANLLNGLPQNEVDAVNQYISAMAQAKGVDLQVDDEIAKAVAAERERLTPFIWHDALDRECFQAALYKGQKGYITNVSENGAEVSVLMEGESEPQIISVIDEDLTMFAPVLLDDYMADYEQQVAAQMTNEVENARVNNPKTNTLPQVGNVISTPDGQRRVAVVTDDYRVLLEPDEYKIDENTGQQVPIHIGKFSGSDLIPYEKFVGMQNEYWDAQDKMAREEEAAVEDAKEEVPAQEETPATELQGAEEEAKEAAQEETPATKLQGAEETVTETQDVEQPQLVEEDNNAMPMVEVKDKKSGEVSEEPDFAKAGVDRSFDYLYNEAGLDRNEANAFVRNGLEQAKAEQKKIEDKKPDIKKYGTNIGKYKKDKADWEAQVDAAKGNVKLWQNILNKANAEAMRVTSNAMPPAAPVEAQQQESVVQPSEQLKPIDLRDKVEVETAKPKRKKLEFDEPVSLRDWIMQALYNKAYKFNWSDSEDGKTKGLGSHLGLKTPGQYFWLQGKDSLSPEKAAERMLNDYATYMGWEGTEGDWAINSMDMLNELLDVLQSYPTQTLLKEAIYKLQGKAVERVNNKMVKAETDPAQEAYENEQKDLWAKDMGFNTYDEWENYVDMISDSVEPMTKEEYEENIKRIAEEYDKESLSLQQNEQLNTENNGQEILQPTDARIQGGTEVLSGEQVHDTGRSEGSLGDGQGVSTSEYGEGTGNLSQGEGTGQSVEGSGDALYDRFATLTTAELKRIAKEKEDNAEDLDKLFDEDKEYDIIGYILNERGEKLPQLEETDNKFTEEPIGNTSSEDEIKSEESNVNVNPTDGQKKAGNYKKGHIKVDGFNVTIENPKGSIRRGTDANGREWEQEMHNSYGYIRGTEGVDGDHIDVFMSDYPDEGYIYVIDQVKPDGTFDEHKVMYGFDSVDDAMDAYLSNYEEGWQGLGAISRIERKDFKKWIDSSDRKTKPFSEYHDTNKDTYIGYGRGIKQNEPLSETDPVKRAQQIVEREKGSDAYAGVRDVMEELMPAYRTWRDSVLDGATEENVWKAYSSVKNKLDRVLRGLTDEQLNGIEDAFGEDYTGILSERVEAEERRREQEKFTTNKFNEGLAKQGKVTGTAKKPKADLDAFTDKKELRPAMNGVYYDPDGYAVASDGFILIADKTQYDKKNKGKIVLTHKLGDKKKGDVLENDKFPKWRTVIPSKENLSSAVVNWNKVRDFLAGAEEALKARWQEEKDNGGFSGSFASYKKDSVIGVKMPTGETNVYNYSNLCKFADAASRLGINEIFYAEEAPLLAEGKNGVVLMQPMSPEWLDKDVYGQGRVYYELDGKAKLQKAEANAKKPSKVEKQLRNHLVNLLKSMGIEVSTDAKEGQEVLDMANEQVSMSKRKKQALETVVPEGKPSFKATVVSSADGAKVLNNLETFAKNSENIPVGRKNSFISDLAKVLKAERRGSSSEYAKFETVNGTTVLIRLADHNATVSKFDHAGEDNGISIVISRKGNEGVANDGDAHIVEFYYPDKALKRADGNPYSQIVRSIQQALYSGEYRDITGLAEREEVNPRDVKLHKVFHGSGADFDAFDHSFMGTGEGNQTFGWGTYVTEAEGVGRGYAKRIGDTKVSERRFIEGKIEEARKYNIPAQVEYWENELKEKNLENAQHYLYKVEIPEDDGSNYIDYFGKMQDQQGILDKIDNYMTSNEVYGFKWKRQNPDQRIQFRSGSRLITLTPNQSGADLYEEFKDAFGAKPASEILHAMGITGIKVPVNAMRGGNEKGEMNYVIFNENDARITDKVRFFKTPDGNAYGFTSNGKIYIDPRIAGADTPIHEYAHLWCEMKRKTAPEEWEAIKKAMLDDSAVAPIIERLKKEYPELTEEGREDDFVEEVVTQFSGKRGAERLREVAEEVAKENGGKFTEEQVKTAFQRLKDILNKFWQSVAKMLGIKYRNANDVADMVMSDLLNGKKPESKENRDKEYLEAVENGDTKKERKLVEEAAKDAGYTIRAYHGTARKDRVGNVFRPERATSGPMAFFTDSREIAENYSHGKPDTSIGYDSDYDDYETQFRAKHKKTGKDYAIWDLWGFLPFSERAKLAEQAGHIREDWDGDGDVIYDPETKDGNGAFRNQVKDYHGNVLRALVYHWLKSGQLWKKEADFLKVLEKAGVNEALDKLGFEMPRYLDPEYREEGVYDVYLKMENPFDATDMVDEKFIQGFEEFAAEHENEYVQESKSTDGWDKNDVTAEDFAENMRQDIEDGRTNAWTAIPDVATAYLKSLGFDGIKDKGGKYGGSEHTVYVPFSSEQVKSAALETYDDAGNLIPLSERFDSTKEDIRYQKGSDNLSVEERDKEYADAVAAGDMEKVDAMLREEAARKGYSENSDYQGSLAFNGAAPSKNGYYETKEERKEAFENGELEGEYSLGDFADNGVDGNDLGWQLDNPIPASGRDAATLESIRNLANTVKGKKRTIKMYRAVDADIKEDSFRNGDWVTPSRKYAEQHIGLQNWKKGRIIEQEVPIDDIWWNGDDINEWGYDDGKGYAYKNTPNNRKLMEPTYDEEGNLIPLSQRFNEERDDILFRDAEDIFISNAEKAVENIKQEKATPEQWLKMIEKAGGLKAGEDKWMGLSDWLKENKSKTLTKDEVLDYIRQNKIQIEEVDYAAEDNVDDNPKMQEFRKEFDELVSKYETEMNNVEEESNAFNDEMFEKYGQGWANDPERMSEEDQQRNDGMIERWHKLNDNSVEELAFADMVDEYGDDFEQAFDIDRGGGTLEPARDWDGTLMDAARYFLDIGENPINETRLNYTTEGLDNKREIALVVPSIESWNAGDEIHFGDAGEGRAVAWVRFGDTTIPVKEKVYKSADELEEPWDNGRGSLLYYPKGMKGGKDYIVYGKKRDGSYGYGVIVNEAGFGIYDTLEEAQEHMNFQYQHHPKEKVTGNKKVLVIDEIQSKRHQEGREKGYVTKDYQKEIERLTKAKRKAQKELDDFEHKMIIKYDIFGNDGSLYPNVIEYRLNNAMSDDEKQEYERLQQASEQASMEKSKYELANGSYQNKVPDAPFDKNWHELAMKRMLRYAAENGYDKVAWTKGEQQAERYNIGNVVSSIDVTPYEAQSPSESDGHDLVMTLNDGTMHEMFVQPDGTLNADSEMFNGKKASEVFGKGLAEKIMSANEQTEISGDGLRIGGEGMKGFYDQILPRFMDKYGKKWGVKTGEIELPNLEESAQKMWSVDVTPEMRGDVMDGQVMFREVGDKKTLEQLEKEPTVKVYRAMQLIDGELYPPMSAKENGKLRQPSKLGVWEEAEERPDLADENGYFKLDKGNGKSLKARYNPYFHTSRTMLNDQFSEAQNRDNLVVVEMEVPVSELTSDYKADKAKDSVGVKQWKAGVIQGQLSGTREVILSRWAKPVRIVPNEEVAENIARQIRGQVDVMPTNVVTPQVREEMEKQGVKFVKTDNRGVIQEGENAGKTWASVYGRKKGMRMREGDDVATPTQRARSSRGRYTKRQIERANRKATEKFYNTVERMGISDRVHVYESGQAYLESLGKKNPTSVDMRKARSKGWFDPKTKQIYIIVANNRGLNDTMATLLHEGVTHYGLRELVGEERFDQFIDDVYDNAVDEIQEKIDALAERLKEKDNGRREDKQYQRVATEEYMAKLAEEMDFDNDSPSGWKATLKAWWYQIKESFFEMMHKLGLGTYDGAWLTDNELRYILWRSWKNLTEPGAYRNPWNVEARAEDRAMQDKLKVGEYAEDYHGLINSKDVVAVNSKPTMLDGYTRGIGVEIDMTKGRHLNLFVNPMSGEVQVMSGTRGFTNGQRMRMEGEYLDNILGQRIANDIMENAGAGETKLQPMETTAQKQEAQPVAKAAESNEQVNKAINAIRTEGINFLSDDMKEKVIEANNLVKSRVKDALAIIQTPYGYVMVDDGARAMRKLLNLDKKPFVVFPEDKMSDVLPVLIRAGYRVAVAETSNNKAAESGVVKESDMPVFREDDIEVFGDKLSETNPVKRAEQRVDQDVLGKIADFINGKYNQAVKLWNDGQYKFAGWLFKQAYGVDNVVVTDKTTIEDLMKKGFSKRNAEMAVEEMRNGGNFAALYFPYSDKIAIFARKNKELSDIRAELIHESVHQYLEHLPNREAVLDEVWEKYSGSQKKLVDILTDKDSPYSAEDAKEEFFAYMMEYALGRGSINSFAKVSDEAYDAIDGYLNTINYGKFKLAKELFGGNKIIGRRGFIKEELEARERIRGGRGDSSTQMAMRDSVRKEVGGRSNEEGGSKGHLEGVGGTVVNDDEEASVEPINFANKLTQARLKSVESNKENLNSKIDAIDRVVQQLEEKMRKIKEGMHESPVARGAVRTAAHAQKTYDRSTVMDFVEFAKVVMDAGMFDSASKGEVKRLMNLTKGVVGKEQLEQSLNAVADLIIDHSIRESKNLLKKQLSTKGTKVDAKGVEVQGKLDIEGQRLMAALKDGMKLDKESLQTRLADAIDRMGSDNEVVANNAASEYQGLMLAKQYLEEIKDSEAEESALKHEFQLAKDSLKEGEIDRQSFKEFEESFHENIRQIKMERIKAYENLVSAVGGNIARSFEEAKAFKEAEMERIKAIQHNANSDLTGTPATTQSELPWTSKLANAGLVRFFLQPVATFDEMLRFLGKKSADGRGYLWNRFMTDWTKATNNLWKSTKEAHDELDNKVKEIFAEGTYIGKDGKEHKFPKIQRWSDLFSLERKMEGADVEYWDDGKKTYHLSEGKLLYIYMVDKMSDGKMKLRKMGITEEDVDDIKEHLNPSFIKLADWIQDEFLPKRREKYNEVYKRMFGADMAAIDNYFPLKIDKKSLNKEEDLSAYDGRSDINPATITGSVIKRTKNASALDLMHADAFDLVLSHLDDMERWAAFAEFNRDLNTLLSYKRFRNQLQNMSSGRFGAGDTLLENFKTVAAIAGGAYRPHVRKDSVDSTMVNLAKGVTAAKISLRVYTAFKQLLSYPAYLSEANLMELVKSSNPVGAYKAWNWAMENLPLYAERWQSRQAGDYRLKETDMDWQMWKNDLVRTAARVGMSPNAFVDALTVAMGAKAVYETARKRYLKDGFDAETAKEKAMLDASVAYNETQQSSQSAYMSAMQLDRTAASVALTVFRNASMAYERRMLRALSNMKKRMNPDYKDESKAFMQKMLEREGVNEEQAKKASERMYRRQTWRDMVDVAVFGYILQTAWNLAPYLPYLIAGDDDDEKKKMLEDALRHAMFGGIEGLTGGSLMSEVGNLAWQIAAEDDDKKVQSLKQRARYQDFNLLPLMSDLQSVMNKSLTGDKSALVDGVNLLLQSGIGVNPQTFSDAVVATIDAFNGDLGAWKEFAYAVARIMQTPSGAMDMLYIDELGMFAHDARKLRMEDLAKRWARYKMMKDNPLLRWAYSEEEEKELEEKLIKRFENKVKERIADMDDEEVERMMIQSRPGMEQEMLEKEMNKRYQKEADELDGEELDNAYDNAVLQPERKVLSKDIAKEEGASRDSYGAKPQNEYERIYQDLRTADDVREDAQLLKMQEDAKTAGDEQRVKEISALRSKVMSARKGLGMGNDEAVMQMIRENRKKLIEKLEKK